MSESETSNNKLVGQCRQYFGKYRGKVIENFDPLFIGRILAFVAAVPGSEMNWCMPCTPYAGPGVGFYAIPPIEANVWIEFEGGDPNRPIWTGCFWSEGEAPLVAPDPMLKIWKTDFSTLIISDAPAVGGVTLLVDDPAVATPLSMLFNSAGITLNAEPAIFKMMTEEGITLLYPPGTIAMTVPLIEIDLADTSVTLTEATIVGESPDISFVAEAGIDLDATADITLAAAGAVVVAAVGDVSIDAVGGVEVSAVAEVAMESVANLSISSLSVDINAAVEVDGDLLIDGMQPVVI